jgi:hypothetical protein
MESLQAAVSEVIENPQGRCFIQHARRLYILYLVKGEGKGEEKTFQWKLEPWAPSLVIDTEPATRDGFLDYWLTTCNPCPGGAVLVINSGGLRFERETGHRSSLLSLAWAAWSSFTLSRVTSSQRAYSNPCPIITQTAG